MPAMQAVPSFCRHVRSVGPAIACGVAGLAFLASAASADPFGPTLLGAWTRGDGGARIKVERCAHGFCAVSTWTRPGADDEKPGDRLEMTLTRSEPAVWTGDAWDPQHNRSYSLRIEVSARAMVSHGCAMSGLVCKDVSWTRL